MNDIVPGALTGTLPAAFANKGASDDLGAGVQSGYGIITYKGKVWSIRHAGETTPVMRPDGDGAANSLELVIVRSSPHVAKIFYEGGYVDGSHNAPDCWSNDGIRPDISSTKKQAEACAICPKNAWGSRLTPGGKQGKACGDSRRMAVVPLSDIPNERYGGPMLLRVPAASLKMLKAYGDQLASIGYPYYAVGTRISFDPNEAYPKFEFNAIRMLNEDEASKVVELQDKPLINQILAESFEQTPVNEQPTAAPATPVQAVFEQPPQEAPPAIAAQPTPTEAPAATPAEVPSTPTEDTSEDALSAKLDQLLG